VGERHHRSPVTAAITWAALLFLFIPLAVVVLFSFHENASLTLPFRGVSMRWYTAVFEDPDFRDAVGRSLVVAVITSAIVAVLGTGAAFGLTRMPPGLRATVTALFFLPVALPGLFLGLSLLSFLNLVGAELSLATVVIAHCVYVLPFFMLIARTALDRLDPALEESAADLGASPSMVFRRVTLPQVWPVLLAATALAFMLSFDEFVITFFVIGGDSTLPLYVFSRLRLTVDPTINVISTLLLAFSLAVWVVAFALTIRADRRRRRRSALSGGM
jgi:ABC-type spermidine/putrescine transport system permease subunit II